jgi:hypothetical protein
VQGGGEEPLDLVDGQGDQPGVGGRGLVRGGRGLAAGAGLEAGGGDGADGQGGHDEDEVAQDRGVQPCLALVQAEVVLAELEIFLGGPAQPGSLISQVLTTGRPSGVKQ